MEVSISEISNRLDQRVESICKKLFPNGKSINNEWVIGNLAGEAGGSLKIHLTGEYKGRWKDWANPEDYGDLIDLWRNRYQLTPSDTLSEIKSYLGIKNGSLTLRKHKSVYPKSGETHPLDENGAALKYLSEERKLSKEVINKFKIEGDKQKKAIVFPCYSQNGTLINRSYRTLSSPKKVWQEAGCSPSLFGWHTLNDSVYRDRKILLTEGQIDCMTWSQWGIPALSIPNGTGLSWLEYEWENLEFFDTIFISFDNDISGRENARKTIDRLGKHRCMLVDLPHKDANDCLMRGVTSEEALNYLNNSHPIHVEGLIQASELEKRLIEDISYKKPPFTLDFLNIDWPDKGYYPRPGEITIWTGVSNHGKSSIINQFITYMLFHGLNVFLASLEMKAERLVKKMITTATGRPATEEAANVFLKEVGSNLLIADYTGYIDQETLLEMLYFCFKKYGVNQFFIDSLMRIKGLEEEYAKQGDFMLNLQRMAKSTGSHIHLVAHPAKLLNGQNHVDNMSIKGSSLIPNNADNIVSIKRNAKKEEAMRNNTPSDALHDAELIVSKQRENGWEGFIPLKYDMQKMIFTPYAFL